MAKKDSGGKKKKDVEVVVPVNGHEHEDGAPSSLKGHALDGPTPHTLTPAGPTPDAGAPEPPPLPAVGVEPQALPPVSVTSVEPVEPPLADVRPAPAAPPLAPPVTTAPAVPAASGWSGADLADAALVPLQLARSVLPTSRTPVVLGVVALGLVGVLDWPAALGVGLGWEALRRWGPATPRRSGPGR